MSHDKHCCNDKDGCHDEKEHAHHGHHHGECCHTHDDEGCHDFKCFADKLLCMADDAWEEIVYDKISEEIQKQSGDHLSQLANLVVTANNKRWKKKMESAESGNCEEEEKCCETFTNDLKALFTKCGNGQSQECKDKKDANKNGMKPSNGDKGWK